MRSLRNWRVAPGSLFGGLALGLSAASSMGCGGEVDEEIAAQSFDERTRPLTHAIIGTPDGLVAVTGPDGAVVSIRPAASAGPVDADEDGPIPGGAGTAGAGPVSGGGAPAAVLADDGAGFGLWHFDDC